MDNIISQHVYKKQCTACDCWLSFSNFNVDRNSKDGLAWYCKSCRAKFDKEKRPSGSWRKQNLRRRDRKSTRLNSSHSQISYAVFCLKKKKKNTIRLHLMQ